MTRVRIAYDRDPVRDYVREKVASLSEVDVALGGFLPKNRLAVLPFVNMSPNLKKAYFADGLTEELIDRISQIKELDVIARTSVMTYKKTEKKAAEIGRELRAGALVEGSVRKAGGRIRVTAQLVDANTEVSLWSSKYDSELQDVFGVQSDIAGKVAEALRIRLLPIERKAIQKKATESPEAFVLYLKGRYYWSDRAGASLRTAIKYFEKALEKDPKYALAYVGIADCYQILVNHGYMATAVGIPKLREYIAKALDLDKGLGEAHATLATGMMHEWEYIPAEEELRRAITLNPSYASAHHWYSILLAYTGKVREAIAEITKAHELDPNSLQILTAEGLIHYYARDYDKAIAIHQQALETDPSFLPALINLFFALVHASRLDEAKALIPRALKIVDESSPAGLGADAHAYAAMGDVENARSFLAEAERPDAQYTSPFDIGMAHYHLGEIDSAFVWFGRALEKKDPMLGPIKVDPEFDALRKDPRFVELIKRVGL